MLTNQNKSQAELDHSLFKALYKRDINEIKNLLEQGANVNAENLNGSSPLHIAIQHNSSVMIIKMLLEYGAKIDALNRDGRTPLHIAASKRKLIATKELLKNGANVNIKDCNGMTPLKLHIEDNTQKQPKLLGNITFLLLVFGANLIDEIDDNSIFNKRMKKFNRIKSKYPNCAQLIQANEASKATLQYKDIQKLDEKLKNINNSYYFFIYDALQNLKQYMLEKSTAQYISDLSNRDTVLNTLQKAYAAPVREIYNRIEFTSVTIVFPKINDKPQ
ncbi:ankyrin repeat domain-containing protein [Candidatus Mesenet endosymbiont of Phosphuga atrata]|uniref:ankyrin repeat domain-containing protein n=1 Tax=Candidatus Mesenet endosymbiont of Phosphuga atrata TaxID=3066221 RepID=UPI0030CEA9E9